MSPMSLVNCSSPQAPHPSQVPMPTELCPPFGNKYKPLTTINNNNHYTNDNRFCCPTIGGNNSSNTLDQSNLLSEPYIILNNLKMHINLDMFIFPGNQNLVNQLNDHFQL